MQNTPRSKAVLQASSILLLSSFLRPLMCPQWCIFKPFPTPPRALGQASSWEAQEAAEALGKCPAPLQNHRPPTDGCTSLCPCPVLLKGAAVLRAQARSHPPETALAQLGTIARTLFILSAALCWSQMFTLAAHAVSWPETLISPWQSNKAFPRILHATQPGLCHSCPPGTPAGFGGCWEHGGKGLGPPQDCLFAIWLFLILKVHEYEMYKSLE